jgi:ribonucleoside-diphosphate reductase alpha chain
MATLNVRHPDILSFIRCKEEDGILPNFNLSVTITEGGPDAVEPEIWDEIVRHAWFNGEPGVIFLDNVNKDNPLLEEYGAIRGANACAEQPMYHNDSCCLGHIVLPNVMTTDDWGDFDNAVHLAVRFLDRVIDVNHYPTAAIASRARELRRIGIGVMGFYNLCTENGISFVSRGARDLAKMISLRLYMTALDESAKLGMELGCVAGLGRRNSFLTTIAPTGHTARLAGVEHSIYPPYHVALEMTPEQHLDLVAAWQPYIDSAISYTFNFRHDTPPSEIDELYRAAYARGIKCMSVYRDGSRENQPCTIEGVCGL